MGASAVGVCILVLDANLDGGRMDPERPAAEEVWLPGRIGRIGVLSASISFF